MGGQAVGTGPPQPSPSRSRGARSRGGQRVRGKGPHRVWVGDGRWPGGTALCWPTPPPPVERGLGWTSRVERVFTVTVSFPESRRLPSVCFPRLGAAALRAVLGHGTPPGRPFSQEGRPIQVEPLLGTLTTRCWSLSVWDVLSPTGSWGPAWPLGILCWILAAAGLGGSVNLWPAAAPQGQ